MPILIIGLINQVKATAKKMKKFIKKNSILKKLPVIIFSLVLMVAGIAQTPAMAENLLKIVIDPGHGGLDHGVKGKTGFAEKNFTITVARLLEENLKNRYKVVLTRSDDYHLALDQRASAANSEKADIMISIHSCGGIRLGTGGIFIYYLKVSETKEGAFLNSGAADRKDWATLQEAYAEKSRVLAEKFKKNLKTQEQLTVHNVRAVPLANLKGADMPAIIIEAGCLTNPTEEKLLKDKGFLNSLAALMAESIDEYVLAMDQQP